MLRYLLTAVAMCLLACPALAATIYKCRQAGGVTSYQDSPCPGRQIGVLRTPTTAAQARAPAAPAAAPATALNGFPSGDVELPYDSVAARRIRIETPVH